MEMTVKEILIAARAKIADPVNWTQRAFAKTDDGIDTLSDNPSAVCWCAVGAVSAVAFASGAWSERNVALIRLRDTMSGNVTEFNDTHTHAEVLAKFDEAIAAQGGE